ncbi:MAG: hypothetical protein HYV63_18400 [Candidatus Schekmanbacteria bacterium]|nr:hypothetical protein [Candidatus Schekmanbacteria bacterium]
MTYRKYKQHGYMDHKNNHDRDEKAHRKRSSDLDLVGLGLDREDAPKGRSASTPENELFRCSVCSETLADYDLIGSETTCPKCSEDLHTCTNCRYFDTSARFECRLPRDNRVTPKNKRNDCEQFAPRTVLDIGGGRCSSILTGGPVSGADDPKLAFERLFKK